MTRTPITPAGNSADDIGADDVGKAIAALQTLSTRVPDAPGRLRILIRLFGDDWSVVGDIMWTRLFRDGQAAFLSGAFSASVLCSLASVRQLLSRRLHDEQRIRTDGMTIAEMLTEWDKSGDTDVVSMSGPLNLLERRYLNWSVPFTESTIESQLIAESEADGRPRSSEDDAAEVMYRDALQSLSVAFAMATGAPVLQE